MTLDVSGPLLMTDAGWARDRDDAVRVVPRPDGSGWMLDIYLAGVADVVAYGSVADEQAFLRGETRHLQGQTFPMLGAAAEAAATLTAAAERSSLRVTAALDRQGHLSDVVVQRCLIPAGHCIPVDHASVPAILGDRTHPLQRDLAAADAAVQVLLASRRANGDLAFYDLASGWAANEDGAIVAIAEVKCTVAYVIVQELKIAANKAVATWCVEHGLPVLFRNHRANSGSGSAAELMREILSASGDPVLFEEIRGRVMAALGTATYEQTVCGHDGLRSAAYVHVTSPLRRLADLVNQRIIFSHLDDADAPYTKNQLAAIASDLNRRARERRESKRNHAKVVDRRIVAREAAGDLTALDRRMFGKFLKSQTARPLSDALAAELDRRAHAGLLAVSDVAVLIDVADSSWLTTQLRVIDVLSCAHPGMGPSVESAWGQAHPDQPEASVEIQQEGPEHGPRFAVRATHGGTGGPWTVSASKRIARQSAVWAAIRAHLAQVEVPDGEPEWQRTVSEPVSTLRGPVVEGSLPAAGERDHVATPLQLAPSKKQKALSNPVAWLITLARNRDLVAPEWSIEASGPSHAPEFTATVYFAGRAVSALAATKAGAKTWSATALVEDLFADVS
ncbi:RNB domain-containing ribonuclease [Rhodococcus hoagii]|nr:RNB domain-containing ribonuclease [Prescottella equi]